MIRALPPTGACIDFSLGIPPPLSSPPHPLLSPELQAVELEMAPLLAAHTNKVYTFPGLFTRVHTVHEARLASGLDDEQVGGERGWRAHPSGRMYAPGYRISIWRGP